MFSYLLFVSHRTRTKKKKKNNQSTYLPHYEIKCKLMDSSNWLVCANSLFLFLWCYIYIYIRKRTMIERTKNTTVGTIFEKTKIISSCNSFLSLSLSIVRKKDQRGIKFSWRTTKMNICYMGKLIAWKYFNQDVIMIILMRYVKS